MQTKGRNSAFGFHEQEEDLFTLSAPLSENSPSQPQDVVKAKTALKALNSYNEPPFGITDIPDRAMIDGIKNFQSQKGLKVDGVMNPGGPTEKSLNQSLKEKGHQKPLLPAKPVTPQTLPPDVQAEKEREKQERQRQEEAVKKKPSKWRYKTS